MRASGGANPDVRVDVGGRWIYMDAKQPRFSTRAAQEQSWILDMVGATPNGAQLEKLSLFKVLETTAEGRRQLDHIIKELAARVHQVSHELFDAGRFPASRDVDGLVRVHVPDGPTPYAIGPYDWALDSEVLRRCGGTWEPQGIATIGRCGDLLTDPDSVLR